MVAPKGSSREKEIERKHILVAVLVSSPVIVLSSVPPTDPTLTAG